MQIWCDCRDSSTADNLHPVFDNSISYDGNGYRYADNKLMLNEEVLGEFFPINDSHTYATARSRIGILSWLILDFSNWKMIPIENLISECEHSGTKLAVIIKHPKDVNGVAFALEKGVDAIIIENENSLIIACEIAKTQRLEKSAMLEVENEPNTGKLDLSECRILDIDSGRVGERYCIDLTCLISPGEGMLIGSSASSMALVHGEVIESEFVPTRPFRVNAGSPHSYTLMADGKTKYLSELSSGDQIMLISKTGNTRSATIGRLKIEKRPFLRITWQNDYEISNTIFLQQAETVRVIVGSGEAISVTNLMIGDSILCHNSNHTRHIGNKVTITSKEV